MSCYHPLYSSRRIGFSNTLKRTFAFDTETLGSRRIGFSNTLKQSRQYCYYVLSSRRIGFSNTLKRKKAAIPNCLCSRRIGFSNTLKQCAPYWKIPPVVGESDLAIHSNLVVFRGFLFLVVGESDLAIHSNCRSPHKVTL